MNVLAASAVYLAVACCPGQTRARCGSRLSSPVSSCGPPRSSRDLRPPRISSSVPPSPRSRRPPAPKLTKAPKLIESVEPAYPPLALSSGLSADVTLQLDLDAEGNVTAVAVTRPAGNGFDEAASEAALQFRFEPAEVDDKPSAIRIEYVLHFRPKLDVPKPVAPVAEPTPPPPPPDQRVLVRGRMREKGTRDPVAGASVSVSVLEAEAPREIFATTEDDGRFVVNGSAPAGVRLRLVISSGEHEPCIREVTAPAPGPPSPRSTASPRLTTSASTRPP